MPRPRKDRAAALKYDRKQSPSPVLTAKGEGFIARKIVEIAKEANIPIVEDAALISALMSLEIGDEIPEHLYEAVARVLAFLYKVDKERLVKK